MDPSITGFENGVNTKIGWIHPGYVSMPKKKLLLNIGLSTDMI
jgi:hypothetical protein